MKKIQNSSQTELNTLNDEIEMFIHQYMVETCVWNMMQWHKTLTWFGGMSSLFSVCFLSDHWKIVVLCTQALTMDYVQWCANINACAHVYLCVSIFIHDKIPLHINGDLDLFRWNTWNRVNFRITARSECTGPSSSFYSWNILMNDILFK